MAYDISPYETNRYNVMAANMRSKHNRGLANLTYQKGQAGIDYNLQKNDLTKQWDNARQELPGQYAGRGLMNSGIYKQGLTDYADARMSSFSQLQRGYQRQLGDFNQQQLMMETDLSTGLNQIEADKAARRAQVAAAIKGMY